MTRVEEHTDMTVKSSSHVLEHIKNCKGCRNIENKLDCFEIIRQCSDRFECRVAEAFAIKQYKPSINRTMTSQGAALPLTVFN